MSYTMIYMTCALTRRSMFALTCSNHPDGSLSYIKIAGSPWTALKCEAIQY
jgi:hypothetical protein